MDPKEKYRLRQFIMQLENIRGRHTELVSVYVPSGYDIIKIIQHLAQEQGTASNIKDKNTRNKVIDSIEKMIQHLRLFKRTPANGLAVFAGDVSDKESKIDIKVWSIEPPEPLSIRMYRCDQTFLLDPLKNMVEVKEIFGLIVLDRKEGNVGLLKGTNIVDLSQMESGVPGKTKAGGQCLFSGTIVDLERGYKRIEDIKIGDILKAYDFTNKKLILTKCINKWKIKKNLTLNIITKGLDIIASEDHIFFKFRHNKIKEISADKLKIGDNLIKYNGKKSKILRIRRLSSSQNLIDLETDKKNFIANGIVVHNSQQRYARLREEATHEFFKRVGEVANKEFLGKSEIKGIIVGGPGPTKEDFLNGNYLNNEIKKKIIGVKDTSYTGEFGLHELVDKSHDLLAEEEISIEKKLVQRFFEMLAKEEEKTTYGYNETKKALGMGAVHILLISDNFKEEKIESLELEAEQYKTEVRIISTETREGKQLAELGGIAAILRFQIK